MPAPELIEMVGKTYGKWTVLRYSHSAHGAVWHCRCECGKEDDVKGSQLRSGKSTQCVSCRSAESNLIHGHAITNKRSGTYNSWQAMVKRCTSRKFKRYKDYGGRGISVCERWMKFENFLSDMGVRPPRTTIDRLNVDGNYELGNCRWADDKTQSLNKRTSKRKQ